MQNSDRYGLVLLCLVCIVAFCDCLQADTFEIRGGGVITGKLLNKTDSNFLRIRTYDGVELEFPMSKLLKQPTVLPAEIEEAYKSSLAGKEDTAELHKAVSQECKDRQQNALSMAHLERVVELEPTEKNWTAIGYGADKSTGEMVKRDLIQKRKGLVNIGGSKWDTPQSKAITDFDTKQKRDVGDINNRIEQNLRNLNQRGPAGVKAAEFFNTLVDPVAFENAYHLDNRLAIKRISELLLKETNSTRVDWYMELLAKMPENSANVALGDIAMNSPNSQLVNQAIELLERTASSREYAFHRFLSVIQSRDPKMNPARVDRAGSNLQSFVDKRAIPSLIEKLVSIVKITVNKPATNSFSSDGGISQTMGNSTVESKNTVPHPTVLSALLSVVDGVNYEYNIPEWRIWYATTFAKVNIDLRRDE